MKRSLKHIFVLGVSVLCVAEAVAQIPRAAVGDWPWWRGPTFNGVAEAQQQPPLHWSATENVQWKAEIPGRGHSTPIVVGKRVFLQTADEMLESQLVICYDRPTGQRLWQEELNRGNLPEKINPRNTHATSTIASDGRRLYVLFSHDAAIQATALDLEGSLLWTTTVAPFLEDQFPNGYAASPVLYGNSVIVAVDCEAGGKLVALERTTGEPIWETPRVGKTNYASPVVGHVAGRDQLLISGLDMIASYDPRNGKPFWDAPAISMQTSGTPVWEGDLVFAAGGFPDGSTAGVHADGSNTIAWKNTHRIHEQSLLVYQGHVYAVNDRGIAICWEARTGREVWRERLKPPFSASPTRVRDMIYLSNELGTTWIFRATPRGYEELAVNQLGTSVFASPTICGGEVFLRVTDELDETGRQTLYCLKSAEAE